MGSRVDRVLLNRAAGRLLRGFRLDWTCGLPTHAALRLVLAVGRPPWFPARVRAPSLSGVALEGWDEAAALCELERDWAPRWRAALAAGDVSKAWSAITAGVAGFLAGRVGADGAPSQAVGAVPRWRRAYAPAGSRDGDACTRSLAAATRRARQLEAALRLWPEGPGCLPRRAAEALGAAKGEAERGDCGEWATVLGAVGSREQLRLAAERATAEATVAAASTRKERRDRWHAWTNAELTQGGRRVFQWVRSPCTGGPPLFPVADGEAGALVGGPLVELNHATAAWRPLWLAADAPAPTEGAWLRELAALPAFPGLLDLRDEQVVAAFRRLPVGKAPGLDDWAAAELRLWPTVAILGVAALLRAVERGGRWPDGIARAEVVLLPKGAADIVEDPLQRRPITLLPILYRLWARLRQADVARWRRSWDPAMALARLGAEGQAWLFAWEAGMARTRGECAAGIAVDFSKCNDTVRLPLLARVLRSAAWPPGLSGPLLHAYGAPRCLRVGGALGDPWQPCSGIPAGCPLAVDVLAVITFAWVAAVRREAPALARRAYVDDLTAWGTGEAEPLQRAVEKAWDVTSGFAVAFQPTVNTAKMRVVAAPGPLQAGLSAALPGVTVRAEVRDLGVLQQLGGLPGSSVLKQRLAVACERLRRVAVLPLARECLLRVVAAAGVSVAVYGGSCGSLPRHAVRSLRAAAAGAVSRGGRFGAPELRLLLGDSTCRADPAAALAFAPLLALARAVRWGHVREEDALAAWDSGTERTGPVGACRRAMQSLGLGGDPLHWQLPAWRELLGGPWVVANEPLSATRRLLWELWRARAARQVAARRSDFGGLRDGVDWHASLIGLRRARWPPARRGALRSVMVGDVVTEARAAHWREGGDLCPECGEREHPAPALGLPCQGGVAARCCWGARVRPCGVDA